MRRFNGFFEPKNVSLLMCIMFLFAGPFPLLYVKNNFLPVKEAAPVFLPSFYETETYESDTLTKEQLFTFEGDSKFAMYRFIFGNNAINQKSFTKSIDIKGKDISIRWQNYDESPPKWEVSKETDAVPKATLFIETTEDNVVISIPGLYYNKFDHKTIENLPDSEKPCVITETTDGYRVDFVFVPPPDTIGEAWYYKTKEPLSNWSADSEKILLSQDLHKERRFSFDGYYFRTYTTYKPYAENGFFRNPANFTGAHLLKNRSVGSVRNIGYAMTKICAKNQNSLGFWETGPTSLWLYADYGIEYDFYDTRFSTDFARSLLTGYELYKDEEFLKRAVDYAEFLIDFAGRDGYNLNDGALLVPDYYGDGMTKKTHVSLNHQLCEINFLLELYLLTGDSEYNDWADRMLMGIELTEKEWIMPDNNLKYAILYDESVNVMQDYPYLTYNDLFETRNLLERLAKPTAAVRRLMAAKKDWMDKNGVTGYKQDGLLP